ncbi:putative AraC family transcriptional regulator [Actinacidiphila reveromycinica]|uniref:Putative AraC family transcriptional regulator n=1 Tax=Actinacidiphila reveromycinica TaxID=659352 RepID=A0A7U3UZ29_9ACTN|nr:AraC family transcriptional regulator [Streptomyces sp. SN-593]BBB01222.1 putative AraC family transcriptional regulator [Streptomyces sp. SN-593]
MDQLAAAIARHSDGTWHDAVVPRLTVVALDEPLPPSDLLYEPMICFIAEGAKHSTAGERSWGTRRGEMFLNSLVLPVTAVFESLPYRSAVMRLDGRVLADLLLELDGADGPPPPAAPAGPEGQISAPMTPEIVDAVTRWVRLLDTPEDIPALAPRVEAEILYRLLGSPLGPLLRRLTPADTAASRVRAAAAWICEHFREPLTVEAVAAVAHMSPATLHRHFKAATGMGPLRFQKHLRLQEARRRLLSGDSTAALVAEAVGYASATQFNREYRRHYGLPPARDAARLRARMSAPVRDPAGT